MLKMMTMRFTLILLLSLIGYVPFAHADINVQALKRAEVYLSGLNKLKAGFKQVNPDGSEATGTFYLNRPGKLRFEYDDPIEDFIVADGTFIFYYDAELDQQTNTLIGQTLADFILREDLDLSNDVDVTGVTTLDGLVSITLVQKEDPLAGSLTLRFTPEPFELKEWAIIDPQGYQTRIVLNNVEKQPDLKQINFYYQNPKHGVVPTYNQ